MKRQRPIIEPIEADAFVARAMAACIFDLELAHLALARVGSEAARNFALHFTDDGDKTLLDISRVATRKNLPLPKALDAESEFLLEYMREKTGPDFDSAYLERIALHHRELITLFKRGQTIKVPEISALASRLLARAEARVKMSRHLSGSIDQLLDASPAARLRPSPDMGSSGP